MRKMFQEESRIQLCYINTADELKNLRTDRGDTDLDDSACGAVVEIKPEPREDGAGEAAPRCGEA